MLFVTPNSNLCINYRNHNGDKPYQWIAVSEPFFIHFIYSHLFSSLLFQFQSMFIRILVMWRKLLKSCVLCLIVMTALWLAANVFCCVVMGFAVMLFVVMVCDINMVCMVQGSKLRGAEGQNAPKLSPNAPRLLNLGAKFCYPIQPDICFEA